MSTVVPPPGSAEPAPAIALPAVVRVGAGSSSVVRAVVTNTAHDPRELLVLAVGVDQAWLRGPVRTRVLAPGESLEVDLPLAPTAGTLPAEYPLAVTVQAIDPATGRAAGAPTGLGETSVVVNPRAQITFDVVPERTTFVRSRKLRATVRNAGAVPATVQLQGTGTQGLLVTLRRREVTVAPGAEVTVRGRLLATRPRRVGGSLSHAWSINATSPEIVRQVRGTAQQRALFGSGLTKAVAVLAVVAVWAAAVLVLVQEVPKRIQEGDEASQTAGDAGADGAGGADGKGGAGGTGADGGKLKITRAKAGEAPTGLQIAGTVEAVDPSGVGVTIEAISLASQEAEQADNIDEVRLAADVPASGKLTPASFVLSLPTRSAPEGEEGEETEVHGCSDLGECAVDTTEDGAWAIADVKPTGYYLVTFSKPGLVTQRHVIDASRYDPTEPLTVAMEPGDGALSGTVKRGQDLLAGATVVVSDGTSTITTSTASSGPKKGRWEVSGLDTPATYTVEVSSFGLATESLMADLREDQEKTLDVSMRAGAALVRGYVSGRTSRNRSARLGGVAVTLTDSAGEVRSATTATDGNQRGFYSFSGVPAPGEYVATFTAPGYQTQTERVVIGKGTGRVDVPAVLEPSTGSVVGQVLNTDGEVIDDAGLTLSDGTNTYKTRPQTSPGDEGEFVIADVVPGTYRLTTERYKYETSVLTVEVEAGDPTEEYPVLEKVQGEGGVPATSTITGQAVTAGTGEPIVCDEAVDGADCIKAEVFDAETAVDGPNPQPVGLASDFGPGGDYVVPARPDVQTADWTRLAPGLYTVRVSAPHYETARMRVAVGQDEQVVADTIQLEKAPKVTGTLTSAVGEPSATYPTCVWLVRASANVDLGALDCATTTPATCTPVDASYEDQETLPDRVCAKVTTKADGDETFSLEVPRRGDYDLVVDATDPEFVDPAPERLSLAPSSVTNHDVRLNRLGRVTLDVRLPDDANGLPPHVGATLTAVPASASVPAFTQQQSGSTVTLSRLDPDQSYSFHVSDGTRISRDVTVQVGINQEETRVIAVRPTSPALFFQVTSDYLGEDVPQKVRGARVTVTGQLEYIGTQLITQAVSAATNGDGCVQFKPAATARAARGACTLGQFTNASAVDQDFMFPRLSGIAVDAQGYKPYSGEGRASTTNVDGISLDPEPLDFTGQIVSNPPNPTAMLGARFRVEQNGTAVPGLTVGNYFWDPGNLVWNDPRGGFRKIVPGRYTITADVDGYESDSATILCTIDDTKPADPSLRVDKTCRMPGSNSDSDGDGTPNEPEDLLRPVRLGALTVRATDQAGNPVTNALVTLKDSRNGEVYGQQQASNTSNEVTFNGLRPSLASYVVSVQAPSYETQDFPTDGALVCGASQVTGISIPAGGTLTCQAKLKQLGTFSGTVSGNLGSGPDTVRYLSGATVSAVRCTERRTTSGGTAYCAKVDASTRLTVNAAADGSYSLTGNAQIPGITLNQDWLVSVTVPGWTQPRAAGLPAEALNGSLQRPTTGGLIPLDLTMDVVPVDYTVTITDQAGATVNRATVKLVQSGAARYTTSGATTPVTNGRYVFTGITPGQYTVELSGGNLITLSLPVDVLVGRPTQGFSAVASKAVNSVQGQVLADDVTGGLAGATVTVVACTSAGCGTTAAEGTDEQPMRMTSDAAGGFLFRNVPNGSFAVRFTKLGYEPRTTQPFPFDHTLGSATPFAVQLQPYQHPVEVTLTSATADLTGAKVTITEAAVDGNFDDAQTVPVTVKTASFTQVRFGCWNVSLELPTDHYGTVKLPRSTTNDTLGCSGNLVVPPTAPAGKRAVAIEVVETKVDLSVGATALPGNSAPGTATITLTGPAGFAGLTLADLAVGSTKSVWVPPGDYTATADVPSTVDDEFWPRATTGTVDVRGAGPVQLKPALQERKGTLKYSVTGATSAKPVSVRVLRPASGQSATLPAEYANAFTVTSDAIRTLSLPAGPWLVTANFVGGGTPSSQTPSVVSTSPADADAVVLTPLPPPTP